MITSDFVFGAIDGLISRFDNGSYVECSYCEIEYDDDDEPYEIQLEIDKEMEIMFTSLNIQHNIELIEAFENPAVCVMVLCIAFVIDGKLYTKNLLVERR